jgi:proteic killer suppression protein
VILSFKDAGTEDIYDGLNSKAARKTCPRSLWNVAVRKLDHLNAVIQLKELANLPGNHLEALHGDREGQYSIRINRQYRICFNWTESGPMNVEITDYH